MICLVSDRRRLSAGPDAIDRLVELVAAGARAGIDIIQIRERDLEARVLLSLVDRCRVAIDGTRTKLVVNERADVAIAAGAHGVHLRADSCGASALRSLIGDHAVIGRSIHSAEEAGMVWRAGGVDYLIFGTVYRTASKDAAHPVASLDELSAACRAVAGEKAGATYGRGAEGRADIPVLAIGGITVQRAAEVARAGAAGVAGIGLFLPPIGMPADRHLQSVVDGLRRAFDTCEAVP
jgi:thiamine-phosphate diphosphorylase